MSSVKLRRVGITNYILGNSAAVALWSIATVVLCEVFVEKGLLSKQALTASVSIGAAGVATVFYSLSSKRLMDLNLSSWLVKVLALPIPGLIILPYLCFVPGSSNVNDYGEPPADPGLGRIFLTIMLALLAFNFFAGAWRTYQLAMLTQFSH